MRAFWSFCASTEDATVRDRALALWDINLMEIPKNDPQQDNGTCKPTSRLLRWLARQDKRVPHVEHGDHNTKAWQIASLPRNRTVMALNQRDSAQIIQQILDEMSCDWTVWQETGLYDPVIATLLLTPNIQEIYADRWIQQFEWAVARETDEQSRRSIMEQHMPQGTIWHYNTPTQSCVWDGMCFEDMNLPGALQPVSWGYHIQTLFSTRSLGIHLDTWIVNDADEKTWAPFSKHVGPFMGDSRLTYEVRCLQNDTGCPPVEARWAW